MIKSLTNFDQQCCQKIKLVATDFDGTVTENGQLTAQAIEAISQLHMAGIQVIIVTGRSAGWVNALRQYLPIAGAIAENGGVYYSDPDTFPHFLVSLPPLAEHRKQLANLFQQLCSCFPHLQESPDNSFRFTDWTFDVAGLSFEALTELAQQCQQQGYSFTYSSVQCHIKPQAQDKAQGLQMVLKQYFPDLSAEQMLTVGDSPNDESLFNPELFPLSVGVANIQHYWQKISHPPQYVTQTGEGQGFSELAQHLIANQTCR
ncbi:MAG: HAD family hydrolase [Cyanobacteria bacterium SW_9_44_58]|nr:MAG: HAD family hydrolase [Cyanobacteria bacterium SW_9_44_58]